MNEILRFEKKNLWPNRPEKNATHHRDTIWLVVSTPLKDISQLGWLSPIYGKIKNVPNHQPAMNQRQLIQPMSSLAKQYEQWLRSNPSLIPLNPGWFSAGSLYWMITIQTKNWVVKSTNWSSTKKMFSRPWSCFLLVHIETNTLNTDSRDVVVPVIDSLVMTLTVCELENGDRNGGFSQRNLWLSIVMLVYQWSKLPLQGVQWLRLL